VIICGYLSGGNTVEEIAHIAKLRSSWFTSIAGEELGVPCYSTIWWFLVRTKPDTFGALVANWLGNISSDLKDKLLVIDGKRLRGISDNEHVTHLVGLFSAEDRLVIAQKKVPDKSCESHALPNLLAGINVEGAIISMDAHYTYVDNLQVIKNNKADFVVGIKDNQPTLATNIRNFFKASNIGNSKDVEINRYQTFDKGHGRIESRQVSVATDLSWLPQKEKWGLEAVIEVYSERVIGDKTERFTRYFGSSRKATAENFSRWIRDHWSIENSLHYVIDVVYGEDASLMDTGYAAENISLIKRLTMNIVRRFDPTRGMAEARRCATYAPEYLTGLLGKMFLKN
jgi:predicted transposase YbfD/YdcC